MLARAEGISIRTLATAIGLSSSRVHQIVAAADLDALDAALGELRAAGWPAPEDPDSGEDTELDGRDTIADRLSDEVSWLRQCADWLAHLEADSYPPAASLRPSADWPDGAIVAIDLARVRAVIDRIADDVDELAWARRVQGLSTAAVLPGRRAERRRRQFDRQRIAQQTGRQPDPRLAQIERLKAEVAALRERLNRNNPELDALKEFQATALCRLAAQRDESTRMRQQLASHTDAAVPRRPDRAARHRRAVVDEDRFGGLTAHDTRHEVYGAGRRRS
jgi:hypothetical protein